MNTTQLIMDLNIQGFRLNIFQRGNRYWCEGNRNGTGGGISMDLGTGNYSKVELIDLVRAKFV